MSKTVAIFGAGSGLGMSIARRFGREGFVLDNLPAGISDNSIPKISPEEFADIYWDMYIKRDSIERSSGHNSFV